MNRALVEVGLIAVLLVGCWAVVRRSKAGSGRSSSDGGSTGGYGRGHEPETGIKRFRETVGRWTTTTNHREIGILYLVFGTLAALWGGMEAMMLRTELLTPETTIWSAETYNALFTTHGVTMLFFFVTPVFFGIGNYFLPLLIGADDMAFPRLNAVGFWLLPPALLIARSGLPAQVVGQLLGLLVETGDVLRFFLTLREPGIGWTLYTPLSIQVPDPQINFLLLGLHLSGISTTVGAINFVVTTVYERGEDVGWPDLDIFSWTMLTTSGIVLFAFPVLGSALVMLLLDRNFGTAFFVTEGGGPILWQHLFWYFGHPEVYIIFLPATGLMSLILPKFAGRKLFGFKFIVYSTLAIGVLSFGVWAHHMFATGIDPRIRASFMAVSIAIAVPSAIKTFNWITTIWSGNLRITAPLLLCVGGIGTFVIGGVTGVFLAVIPIDILYHATYYVVGHFHLILMGIIPFMMFAASYYWYPIVTGRMYDRQLALFQSMLLVTGSTVTFGTLVVIGFLGLPRRHANYPVEFVLYQQVATVGAYVIGISVLLWLYNMLWSYRNGRPIEDADVWNLKETDQFTREWQWFERRLEEQYGIEPTEPETVRPSSTSVPGEGSPTILRGVTPLVGTVSQVVAAAAISGLVGTLLMAGALATAAGLDVLDPAAFGELAELVGLGRNVTVGYALFLAGGMTTWPLLFVAFVEFLPGKPLVVAGEAFVTVISVGFLLAFYTGQTGLELLAYVVFVLIGHWLYGLGLAGTFGYLARRWSIEL
ncbi:cytochrome C oxidase subunit I [halophilic archaeon]|nr:cytochrome C oxidase subunit I [halophilic archaeon]